MRTFYFTCHCVYVGSRFELFRPQLLKYSVSTVTHIILFQSFYETCNRIHRFKLYSDINSIAGCPSIADVSFVLEFNQMASQILFFLSVRVTLFLCAASAEEVRDRAQLRGNSVNELPIRMNLYEWLTPNPVPKPTYHWGLEKSY